MSAIPKLYEGFGYERTIKEWGEVLKVPLSTLRKWLTKDKCTIEEAYALSKRRKPPTRLVLNGESHTIEEWAKIRGLSTALIRYRLKRNKPIEEVLETHLQKTQKTDYYCTRFDCLHQDGSGKCDIGYTDSSTCTEEGGYEDAYEYYYEGGVRGSKSYYLKQEGNKGNDISERSEEKSQMQKKDRYAEDRQRLLGGNYSY